MMNGYKDDWEAPRGHYCIGFPIFRQVVDVLVVVPESVVIGLVHSH